MTLARMQLIVQYGGQRPEGISEARWSAMVQQTRRTIVGRRVRITAACFLTHLVGQEGTIESYDEVYGQRDDAGYRVVVDGGRFALLLRRNDFEVLEEGAAR